MDDLGQGMRLFLPSLVTLATEFQSFFQCALDRSGMENLCVFLSRFRAKI